MKRNERLLAFCALALAGAILREPLVRAAQEPALKLPVRLTTWAVSMSNVATGKNAVIDINITRWSTPAERQTLITAFQEKGQDGLLRALQKTKATGRFRIPGWMGPDPMGWRLGWDLHYAWHQPSEDGGHRLLIATDRQMSFEELRNQPRTVDYPFTLIEIRLNKDGEGEGKAAVATQIKMDKKKNTIELENYSTEPVRLNQVKLQK
jgi:hypothetical protein